MRAAICLLFCGVLSMALAGAKPMSNKDIVLMLRTGYSSESVLAEMERRRVFDSLDPAARTALRESGASAELITALDSGKFRITADEAAQLRKELSDAADRQELATQQTFRDATRILETQIAGRPLWPAQVVRELHDKLAVFRDGEIQPSDYAGLATKKFIALYFSAHWCPPCRKFTPTLVDFYNRVAPQHPEFELIFISLDHSRDDWKTYMREMKMPWPAVDFDQRASAAELGKLCGKSIPSLLVLNQIGQVISQSYDGDKYLGPQKVLDDLEKIMTPPQPAQANNSR